jgi:hypothetical protein
MVSSACGVRDEKHRGTENTEGHGEVEEGDSAVVESVGGSDVKRSHLWVDAVPDDARQIESPCAVAVGVGDIVDLAAA